MSSYGAGSEGRNPDPATRQAVQAAQAYGRRATPDGGGNGASFSGQDYSGDKGGSLGEGALGGAGRTPVDAANLLGIPSDQITPAVERALSRLMSRVDTLVTQLETVQKHQQELARKSVQDPFTGLLSRPSFMQILENEIAVSPPPALPRCLLLCEIADIDELSKTHGQSCKDAMIAQLAEFLRLYIQPPHQVGYLGCNDFAALLYNVDAAEGWRRTQAISDRLSRASYYWDDQPVEYRLVFGVYQIGPGESLTTVMGGVDRELRYSMLRAKHISSPE